MTLFKENKSTYLLTLVATALYFIFGYNLNRSEFISFLTLYTGLFFCYYFLVKNNGKQFQFLIGVSVLFRLIFLFSIPNLSQDFYRFIWDGRMLLEGFNPYLSLPETFYNQHLYPIPQASELYNGMGALNGSNFTNYPPINQLCFLLTAWVANNSILGSIIVMKLMIILAEIGIFYFGKKILILIKKPTHSIFWYLLNPFIIIEMTGNLHFEPVMLFFLVWAIYLLLKNKWAWSAIILAFSIAVKLIPFLFLPLFFQWFIKKEASTKKGFFKLLTFYVLCLGTIALLFLPFYSKNLIANYSNSVGLWFRSFEFNASFYYIFREIGFLFRGYNEIAILGKISPILTILFISFCTFFRKNTSPQQLITAFLFGLSFYYFTTTTMHPWYLATLILLSIFTNYRFPLIWSSVIILSYAAYSNEIYKENMVLISIEYTVVYGYLIWELFFKNKLNTKSINTV